MQPANPKTHHFCRNRNMRGATLFRQGDSRPHPDAARTCQQRTRGRGIRALLETRACMQHPNVEFEKRAVRRSAYSGSATKPALVSVIALFADASASGPAKRGARLVDGQNTLRRIAREDCRLRHGIGFVPCAPDEFEIARVEFARDYIVDECLRPSKDWRQASSSASSFWVSAVARLTVCVRA